MTLFSHRYTTTVIATILLGTSASADVTAQQVWDSWKENTAIYGEGFTVGSEVMSGDTLTISDIAIEVSDEEATVQADLGTMTLTENGDGTVTVVMADSYPMVVELTPEYGEPATLNMTISQNGMSLVVSGAPDAMVYDIAADSYALSVDSIEGGDSDEFDLQEAVITFSDIAGQYSLRTENLQYLDYQLTFGAVNLNVLLTETGGSGVVQGNADIADLQTYAKIAMPLDYETIDPDAVFKEGFAIEGGYAFGAVGYSFDVNADGEEASGNMSVDRGQLAVAFDMDGLSYIGESIGIAISLFIPSEIPFPLDATLGAYGFDMQVPLSQGAGERDARIAFNLTDLALSDTIWNLLDPAAVLPRDPATVALGLDAKVTPFFDMLDPEQQQAMMMADIPGELNSLTLSTLNVSLAGAQVSGGGSFTFDNSDLETFDGLPRPEGAMTFAINGVNGLIDKLVQMDLIPTEEAMMPRMMMGMFATPVGDDMMTSTIEVNSEGHVLANGQRLR